MPACTAIISKDRHDSELVKKLAGKWQMDIVEKDSYFVVTSEDVLTFLDFFADLARHNAREAVKEIEEVRCDGCDDRSTGEHE